MIPSKCDFPHLNTFERMALRVDNPCDARYNKINIIMGEFGPMKDLQTLLAGLDRDRVCGKALPTAQLAEEFRAACPLDQHGLWTLIRCIDACSEQLYEHYRALADLFREEVQHTAPDAQTIRLGIQLGLLDDEEWEG